MSFKENLEAEGIDPFVGDCLCVASALQKVVDPDIQFTGISCVLKRPYGNIGHCMLQDLNNGEYYDADGKHDYDEAMAKFEDFTEGCWGNLEDEDCWEYTDYDDGRMIEKICDTRVEKIEEIIRNQPPKWLEELKR